MKFDISGHGRIYWAFYDKFGRPGRSGEFDHSQCDLPLVRFCQFDVPAIEGFVKLTHDGLTGAGGAPDVFWETTFGNQIVCLTQFCTIEVHPSSAGQTVTFQAKFVTRNRLYVRAQGDGRGPDHPKTKPLPFGVSVSGAGIACEPTCDAPLPDGQEMITITVKLSFAGFVDRNHRPLNVQGCDRAVVGELTVVCSFVPHVLPHHKGDLGNPRAPRGHINAPVNIIVQGG
jgi:hypothetical protein